VNGAPTVWAWGVPVLPLMVPGASVSPGSRTWHVGAGGGHDENQQQADDSHAQNEKSVL
jgi:hypothetical protein